MKHQTYLKIVISIIFAAIALTTVSVLSLMRLLEIGADRHRQDFVLFLAQNIEHAIIGQSNDKLGDPATQARILQSAQARLHPPHLHLREDDGPLPPPPPLSAPPELPAPDAFGPGPEPGPEQGLEPGPGSSQGPATGPSRQGNQPPPPPAPAPAQHFEKPTRSWLLDEHLKIVFATSERPLPKLILSIKMPSEVHEVSLYTDFLRLLPSISVVKLDREPSLYLVIEDDRRPMGGPIFMTQVVLTFVTVIASLIFAFAIVFIYLRKKSREASAVLLRLEQGELDARFSIQRFDQFGRLILDFNRMADEIEKLVKHVHQTESTRKNLLQELGHDLRTPLTSLTTSFETLKYHDGQLKGSDRADLFEMIEAEISYFRDLLEKLMTIASLDAPTFKVGADEIDVAEIVRAEIRLRQTLGGTKLNWLLVCPLQDREALVLGDSQLILRLVKNSFDNAAKFARTQVEVHLEKSKTALVFTVSDDGPGLDEKALQNFAKRREQRHRVQGSNLCFSLGLGSVIMKAIAELHGGTLAIRNRSVLHHDNTEATGALLTIQLPLSHNAKNS